MSIIALATLLLLPSILLLPLIQQQQLKSTLQLPLLPIRSIVQLSTIKIPQIHADSALWTSSAAGSARTAPPAWPAATSTTSTRGLASVHSASWRSLAASPATTARPACTARSSTTSMGAPVSTVSRPWTAAFAVATRPPVRSALQTLIFSTQPAQVALPAQFSTSSASNARGQPVWSAATVSHLTVAPV